jgi:HK97 family phage portal protein
LRFLDRLLARASQDIGYWEGLYSGAIEVTATDSKGRGRERASWAVAQGRDALLGNGVVFECIAVRMALLSEARFIFQSTIDKHLFGTTDLSILEYPWPNATQGELLARIDQDVSTAGNAYVRRAVPADGSDDQLVQMRPDAVTIISEEIRDTQGRVWKRPVGYEEDLKAQGFMDRDPQYFTVDEVSHYSPIPDPKASFKGMSWLTPVLREIGADAALTEYKTTHVQNGAQPGLVLKYPRSLSDSAVDKLKKRFAAIYGGPENSGKTLVLDEGADVTVAGSTLEQLQFTAVQAAGVERIASAAQVPLEVLGVGQMRGVYQDAMRRFADLWARPTWRGICASLQHLLPDVTPPTRLWFDVSDIAALREGELERSQATLVRAQAVASFVTAGYTRESAIAAADSGDIGLLKPDPRAMPPGIVGRETATSREVIGPGGVVEGPAGSVPGKRAPQAGKPEALPGVVKPNVPNAKPYTNPPMPSLPNGARG